MISLYHNPACSKSREALAILERLAPRLEQNLNVIHYLDTPLNATQLTQLHKLIGGEVIDMVRQNEDEFARLKLDRADAEMLIMALAAHPKLLQRPIVLYKGQAIIARPPERLLDFFNLAQPA